MYICIICDKEKEDQTASVEHIFPYAIGGNLSLSTVCSACNAHLAEFFDIHMIKHWFIQNRRMQFNISGRTGDVPNPFEKAEMADEPSQKVQFKIVNGEPQAVYNITNVIREEGPEGQEQVTIRVDKSDEAKIPEILNKIIERYKNQGKDAILRARDKIT